jgi:hypothetical protein
MSINNPNPNRFGTLALLIALAVLILLFLALMRVLPSGYSDAIPVPYPSDEPGNASQNSEQATRKTLRDEGWQDILGGEDTAIARSLNLKGQPIADFVGYKDGGHWLIAEVKGIEIKHAVDQLANTYAGILKSGLPTNSFEFRLYLNANAYTRLQASYGYGNYFARAGYLETNQAGQFYRILINGMPIQVLPLP